MTITKSFFLVVAVSGIVSCGGGSSDSAGQQDAVELVQAQPGCFFLPDVSVFFEWPGGQGPEEVDFFFSAADDGSCSERTGGGNVFVVAASLADAAALCADLQRENVNRLEPEPAIDDGDFFVCNP